MRLLSVMRPLLKSRLASWKAHRNTFTYSLAAISQFFRIGLRAHCSSSTYLSTQSGKTW